VRRDRLKQDYLGETYLATSLGIPGPGTLTEYISLPERALVRTPAYLGRQEVWEAPKGRVDHPYPPIPSFATERLLEK
jgi:hypothetical protein